MYQECVELYQSTKSLLIEATNTIEDKDSHIKELEDMVNCLKDALQEIKSQLCPVSNKHSYSTVVLMAQ